MIISNEMFSLKIPRYFSSYYLNNISSFSLHIPNLNSRSSFIHIILCINKLSYFFLLKYGYHQE